jgi:hypothetical protein
MSMLSVDFDEMQEISTHKLDKKSPMENRRISVIDRIIFMERRVN